MVWGFSSQIWTDYNSYHAVPIQIYTSANTINMVWLVVLVVVVVASTNNQPPPHQLSVRTKFYTVNYPSFEREESTILIFSSCHVPQLWSVGNKKSEIRVIKCN